MRIIQSILIYLLSIIILIISLPLQIFISIVLVFDLKEFPFFIQDRGLTLSNGRFNMIKFRTLIKSVKNVSKGTKEFLTSQNGNNTTAFTSFLRRTGLDELPQLFHVAAGKMKIVGPRPLMISDIKVIEKQYPEFYSFRNSMKLRPGITGLWQLYGQKDSGIEDLSKFDINYYTTNSFIKDLKIIGITFRYMMKAAKK